MALLFENEDKYSEVGVIIRKSIVIILISMCIIGMIYFFIPDLLIHPYIYKYKMHHSEITQLATSFFYVLIVYQIFDGVRLILSGILRGHGNSMTQMLVGIGVFWLLGIPLMLFLINYTNIGAIAVPLSLTIAVMIGTGVLTFYCMKKVIK